MKTIYIIFILMFCQTAQAGGGMTGGATSIQQAIAQVEHSAQTGIQTGMASVQGTMASVQANQYVVQMTQYAKQVEQYITEYNQLQTMYANLTNPQWYLQKLNEIPAWQKGNQLYNVANGTSSKSTRDSVNQVHSYTSIVGSGAPTAAQLQSYNATAASAAADVVVQADQKQAVLADQSKMKDDLVTGAAAGCNGTNDCGKAQISIAGVQTDVQIATASTLASMQAAQAADHAQQSSESAAAQKTAQDMEAQRKRNQDAFKAYMAPPVKP